MVHRVALVNLVEFSLNTHGRIFLSILGRRPSRALESSNMLQSQCRGVGGIVLHSLNGSDRLDRVMLPVYSILCKNKAYLKLKFYYHVPKKVLLAPHPQLLPLILSLFLQGKEAFSSLISRHYLSDKRDLQ